MPLLSVRTILLVKLIVRELIFWKDVISVTNFCDYCGAALEAVEVDYDARIEIQKCPQCGEGQETIRIPEEACP